MQNKNSFPAYGFLILWLLFFLTSNYLHFLEKKPIIKVSKQDSSINFNDDLINLFALGQQRLISNVFWISTLLESDLQHYKKKDLNNWLFLRFNTISKLDPLFLMNYQFGGQYLSIVKDDLKGASIIFEKGLKHYPEDYRLLYYAGFLYAFELFDYKRAIEIYETLIETNQAPGFIKSLVIKLKHQEVGDLNLTYDLLKETLKTSQEGTTLYKKLKRDLYAIKATIDLECLNNKGPNCSRTDEDGNPYVYRNGKFESIKPFEKYEIYIKKESD
tara:strand:+ start:89049 stop:89867 length:819 start_codon:yes stop_codon:yes gene_type:complete